MTWRNIADCYTMLGQPDLVVENYANAAGMLAESLRINPTGVRLDDSRLLRVETGSSK